MWTASLRRFVIFGAPIGLGALAAVHPMTPDDNVTIWNIIHAFQIPLAALLGMAMLLLLHDVRGPIARMARLAIVPWVAFFAAYDGVLGIATGALAQFGHAHPESADAVMRAAMAMTGAPFAEIVLPFGMVAFAVVVFGGSARALRATGVSAYAAIAIAIGGVVWTLSHPLIGAPAMLVFLIGAAAVEVTGTSRRADRGVSEENVQRVRGVKS